MIKAVLAVLLVGLSGCSTYYGAIRIPDTPDGLAAYRQCATAPHFDQVGACMAGIPDVQRTPWSGDESQLTPPQGCRQIITGAYRMTIFGTYDPLGGQQYIYSVQACKEPTPPPMQ
jgi:hypothetical protein